jgi:hypothetical protein
MNVIQHANGIYEIENFLNDEEQELFLSSCTDDGWEESHPGNIVKVMTDKQQEITDKMLVRLAGFFNNMDSFTTVNRLRRLTTGQFMHPHKDGGDPLNPKVIVFGIAIYLNDDFLGGQLSYPDIGLSIDPKPRSAVIHNARFNHEVKTVTSGNRYSITAFIFGDETTNFNGHAQDNNQ